MNNEFPAVPSTFDLTIRGTGAVIQQLRKAHGLTQEQLGRMIGCLKSDIARYEGNSVGIPFSRLMRIAAAFSLTPYGLLQKCLEYAKDLNVPLNTYTRIVKAGRDAFADDESPPFKVDATLPPTDAP